MKKKIAKTEDNDKEKQAFEWFMERMAAVPMYALESMTANVQEAAIAVLGVTRRIDELGLAERFRKLPPDEFDSAQLEDLPQLAWAALYAWRQANTMRSRGQVPAFLSERSAEVEDRMQRCCEYHLSDHPEAGPIVLALRPGTSLRDRAGDLMGYGRLYRQYADILKADTKYYRAEDADLAMELGQQIFTALGDFVTESERSAAAQLGRIWTLLVQTYNDVADTGRWLLRRDRERAERLFPSLFVVGRGTRSRRQDAETPESGSEQPAPVKPPAQPEQPATSTAPAAGAAVAAPSSTVSAAGSAEQG